VTAIVVAGPGVVEAGTVARDLAPLGSPVVLTPAGPPSGLAGLVVDLAAPDAVVAAFDHAASAWGPVGAAVILPAPGEARPLHEVDDGLWAATLDANLTTAMHVCRAAGPMLAGSGGGAIALVTFRAGAGRSHLAAAAGAVELLSRALAVELGAAGVRVNAVAVRPGEVRRALPIVRLLLSPDAGYLTGEVLTPEDA
jgi:NAD(P)-dependent dehydrogenase (short-subunit alcohol dehydrogenase family)